MKNRLAFILAALLLGGCTGLPGRALPTLTLVPTLALIVGPTSTFSPSATQAPETATFLPTETFTVQPTAADTVTPWVQDTNTPGPSPTVTRTPTATRIPTRTRVPTRTPTITLTPTITFTPTPPPPVINLIHPGLMSKVVSPIQMEFYAITGAGGKVLIELIGEDGRIITRQEESNGGKPDKSVYMVPKVPFHIDAAAETARLQVSTQDEFGRLERLASVDLLLLGVGRNEINPPAIVEEPYIIRQPKQGAAVIGGTLVIDGLARPLNSSPLIFDLVTEDGAILTSKETIVPPPTDLLSHTPFTVEIPYQVDGPTPVRLIIRQEGSRILGTVALTSLKLTLLP